MGAIGREARSRGFNVQLAGDENLMRDPGNGRNFEYLSEDPWHSALLAAESVNGIQAEGVISTVKHFCLNSTRPTATGWTVVLAAVWSSRTLELDLSRHRKHLVPARRRPRRPALAQGRPGVEGPSRHHRRRRLGPLAA